MDEDFYKQQARRARGLAERYDVRGGNPSRASRLIEQTLPITRAAPASREKPGEA
jgi:hypothetical protein